MIRRIAILQFAPVLGTLEPNLGQILAAVKRAARAAADILVAPEMSLTGWTLSDPRRRRDLCADVERVALPALAKASQLDNIGIVVGGPATSQPHRPGSSVPSMANAVFAFAPDGSSKVYRKLHLFGAERGWWRAGERTAVVAIKGSNVGLSICYDAEFPEVPRMTRLAGADLLVVPATNMTPYEIDQELIFRTRAIENEFPVIVANRVGREEAYTYFGRSLVCDRRGGVIAVAGSDEELLLADVEMAGPHDEELSYVARRRPEVYSSLAARSGESTAASDLG